MKLLFDTNVLIDILTQRKDFYEASLNALLKAVENCDEIFVSTCAINDIMYITRKSFSDSVTQKAQIYDFLQAFNIVSVSESDIDFAFKGLMTDFEDAVQASCAAKVFANYIITRNTKDYMFSPVPAITPADFCPSMTVL